MLLVMSNLFKLILFLPIILACNKSENQSEASYAAADEVAAEADYKSNGAEPNAMDFEVKKEVANTEKQVSKILKEGAIGCELKDYHKDKAAILALITKYGGYLGSESETKESYRITNDLVIRISSAQFDALMNGIGDLASNVDYKRITATDVTEEYVDIQTRLKTKKEVEKRYMEFLSRAKNIEEVLKVENELRVIREEIEAKEGRLKFLNDRVAFSTINLNIYQNYDYSGSVSKKPGFLNKIGEGLYAGWSGILNFMVMLTYLWPVWLIGGGLIFLWIKRRKAQKANN
jgi:hypothetical protein